MQALLLALALLATTNPASPAAPPRDALPATRPADPRPPQAVHLADGTPVRDHATSIRVIYRLEFDDRVVSLADAYTRRSGQDVDAALIILEDGEARPALRLGRDLFPNLEWMHAATAPGRREAWAVAETWHDDRAGILLARTTDAGLTWRLTPFPKPPGPGTDFHELAAGPDGQARLTLRVTEDVEDDTPPGHFHYVTRDGGDTWTLAAFDPDHLQPAEQISEDEDFAAPRRPASRLPTDGRL